MNKTSIILIIFVQVLSATLNGSINCSCNHLTSFGGGLLVEPNPIDFGKVLVEFKNIGETGNVAVIVTVAVVLLCYIVVLVIVRRADAEDTRNVRTSNKFNSSSPSLTRNLKSYRVMGPHQKNLSLLKVLCRINGLRVPIIRFLLNKVNQQWPMPSLRCGCRISW